MRCEPGDQNGRSSSDGGIVTCRGGFRCVSVGSQRVAASDDVVMVEGNAYFPPSSARRETLTPSRTKTLCPWKGIARYYTLTADGVELPDAAWSYEHPLPLARRIKGRIAFGAGADIRPE